MDATFFFSTVNTTFIYFFSFYNTFTSDAQLNLTNVSQQDLVKDYCKNISFVCGNDGFVCNGNINALVYTHKNTHRE